jgi:hypothetical protein
VDHHVDAVAEHIQVTVGDQRGDLDEPVLVQIKTGHLAVDPHQFFPHSAQQ